MAHDHGDHGELEHGEVELGREEGRDDGYGAVARTFYATMFGAVLFTLAMTIILVQ